VTMMAHVLARPEVTEAISSRSMLGKYAPSCAYRTRMCLCCALRACRGWAPAVAEPHLADAPVIRSITGVGSNMVNRIIPQRLWSNKSIAKESRD